jgi:hypothetical protein
MVVGAGVDEALHTGDASDSTFDTAVERRREKDLEMRRG